MAPARAKAPTIIDVAAEAGVSKSVVSRALLGQDEVSEATRQRVRDAAEKLGYVANAMASGLRSRTNTLGVVLRDLTRPFYGELLAGMQEAAERAGYRIVTATSADDLDATQAVRALRHLVSMQVDGLVVASARLQSDEIVPLIDRVPIVVAGRSDASPGITSVSSDDAFGGSALAHLALSAGHRRLAVILVDAAYSQSQHARSAATIEALHRADAAVDVWPVPSDSDAGSVLHDRLRTTEATALLCPTDAVAVEALDVLRLLGRSAPDDLSVTGYDGIGPLATPFLGLTTFRVPVRAMGGTAIDLLAAKVADSSAADQNIALRGEVVPGRTLGALR